jgi:hypothetical protein
MGSSSALANRAADIAVIKAPVLNVSLGSLGVISLGAVLTWWKSAFEFLFGASASTGVRETVLVASIAAFVVVVAADMIARAIATHYDVTHVVPWGKGWEASWIKPGADEDGFIVAGMRVSASNPDAVEYLLVKSGDASVWRAAKEVKLKPPA